MALIIKTTLFGLLFGTFGTTIGGITGVMVKSKSNKFLSLTLSLASGLMTSIVCFDLIPEALEISQLFRIIIGIVIGATVMIGCDKVIEKNFRGDRYKENQLLKTGIIVAVGLAIHNFPEGLAIGSGFNASLKLGYSLAIAIALHDIPEGISMAVPMKNGGMNPMKVIWYVILSGIATGIGAFFGVIIGGISPEIISFCLSFAAGAMLYIASGELTPEANNLYKGKMMVIGYLGGFILGMFSGLF